jgi:hypothetical protein
MATLYTWIGIGVVSHGGKSYGQGDPLPADLPAKFLKSQRDKGNIVEMPETPADLADDDSQESPELEEARANLKTWEEKVSKEETALAGDTLTAAKRKNAEARLVTAKEGVDVESALIEELVGGGE